MKGITEIEITDVKTGEKETFREENTVTNFLPDFLSIMAANYPPYVAEQNFLPIKDKVIGGVCLFKNPQTVDADQYVIPYNQERVGYSTGGASNLSDPKRGSKNLIETEVTGDSIKLVWDFTTAQANGTFQSVCIVPNECGLAEPGMPEYMPVHFLQKYMYATKGSTSVQNSHANRHLVSVEYDSVLKRHFLYMFTNTADKVLVYRREIVAGSFSHLSKVLIPFSDQGEEELVAELSFSSTMSVNNGYMYFVDGYDGFWYGMYGSYNSSGTGRIMILKINKQTLELTSLGVASMSGCYLTGVSSQCESYAVVANGYLYIPRYYNSSGSTYYSNRIYKLNLSNLNDYKELVFDSGTNINVSKGGFCRLPNGYVWFGDKLILPDDSYIPGPDISGFYPNLYYSPMVFGRSFVIYRASDLSVAIGFYPEVYATVNNLSSPITKTADKTMKITYTLRFQ